MRIKIARKAGFCYGVKKAVELAEKAAKEYNQPIFTAGPLMHNRHEVERLANIGIKSLGNVSKITGGTLIVRTHGLPKKTMQNLRKKNIRLIDATCPFVKRVQNLVEKLSKEGYNIIVIGEKNHPEVIGLVSYSSKSVVVINSVSGLKNLKLKGPVAVVSQTTQSYEKFNKLAELIIRKYKTAKVINTICNASNERQKEAEKLARKAGIMLVIGGRNSGNTARLKDICSKFVKTYHIESVKEIKNDWFKKQKTVGITAGASTPEWVIEAAVKYLQNFKERRAKIYGRT